MSNDTLHSAATAVAFALGSALVAFGVVLSAFHWGDPTQAFIYGPLFLAGSGLIAWQKSPPPPVLAVTTSGNASVVATSPTTVAVTPPPP